jgi:hypothetical protein
MGTAYCRLINESQATAKAADHESADSAKGNGEQTKNYFTNHVSPVPPDTISQF